MDLWLVSLCGVIVSMGRCLSGSCLFQLSMMSEVRSLVAPQDLEVYDGHVLRREREAHRAWHGGLGSFHPQAHYGLATNDGHVHFSKVLALFP